MAKKSGKGGNDGSPKGDVGKDMDVGEVPSIPSASLGDIRQEWDELVPNELAVAALPGDREEFMARDPFSEDYVLFRKERAAAKQNEEVVNAKVRDDLLEKPYLMPNPVEEGVNGAAAVWRSLRDILHEESRKLIDTSGKTELMMLRRELLTRKAIVEAVNAGIANQLERLDKRVALLIAQPEGGDGAGGGSGGSDGGDDDKKAG